jgi:NitT/TauT family transport system substrate-binding protein
MAFKNIYTPAALVLLTFALAFVLASCDSGTGPGTTPTAVGGQPPTAVTSGGGPSTAGGSPTPTLDPITHVTQLPSVAANAPKTKVTIALGYIPDVQFTPFYVALNKGYYAQEGLDVTFKHGIVPDLVKLLAAGDQNINFAVASGDEIIPARLNGLPVVYVMTWYRQYPVAAVSIKGKGPDLKTPADLKGHTVGVPGPYGSTYTGLLALLNAGGLSLSDIQLKSIGFTQVESLSKGQVDIAMVYAANEPVQLRSQGMDVSTLLVGDYAKLASNGLVTNINTFKSSRPLIARIIRATEKGINYTINNPTDAFNEALKQVPEAGGTNAGKQVQVLEETIKLMKPRDDDLIGKGRPIGWTDVQVWSDTQDFLFDQKIISKKGKIGEMFTNLFIVPASN